MSLRKTCVGILSITSLSVFLVANAQAQPDPFQPLKPEKKKVAVNKPDAQLVSPSACVSYVAESKAASEQRARISAALDRETQIDFNEAPLSEVVGYVRSLHDIPIVLDARAMDDVGLGADTPVTVSLTGISLRSALRIMLRNLELTYVVADGVLQITTGEAAESQLLQHVYPVEDLADPNAEGQSRLIKLTDLVMSTIATDSWDEQGGPGVIVPMEHLGVLVVSQTTDVHEQIADLVVTLRRVREIQAK